MRLSTPYPCADARIGRDGISIRCGSCGLRIAELVDDPIYEGGDPYLRIVLVDPFNYYDAREGYYRASRSNPDSRQKRFSGKRGTLIPDAPTGELPVTRPGELFSIGAALRFTPARVLCGCGCVTTIRATVALDARRTMRNT